MKTLQTLLLFCCLTAVLAACGSSEPPLPTADPQLPYQVTIAVPTATAEGAYPAPAATQAVLTLNAADPVIVLQQSGGIAGMEAKWTIYGDGHITSEGGFGNSNNQITAVELANFLAETEKGGFFDLKESYLPEATCCDLMTYVITITTPDQTKTVTTMDTATMPPSLSQTLQTIQMFINREIPYP